MEFGKPFIVSADDMDLNVPADYNSISDNNCNFSKTNVKSVSANAFVFSRNKASP